MCMTNLDYELWGDIYSNNEYCRDDDARYDSEYDGEYYNIENVEGLEKYGE